MAMAAKKSNSLILLIFSVIAIFIQLPLISPLLLRPSAGCRNAVRKAITACRILPPIPPILKNSCCDSLTNAANNCSSCLDGQYFNLTLLIKLPPLTDNCRISITKCGESLLLFKLDRIELNP
ncbi:hypothetical protein U1Q18_042882 [Sarracenia purpurea var. burkii]